MIGSGMGPAQPAIQKRAIRPVLLCNSGEFAGWVRYGWGDRELPELPKPDGGDRSNGPTAPQWCEGDNRTC